jgi:membrane associated rhomboid family serine protease
LFFPYRCKNPPESLPVATYSLILVNTAVYALTSDSFLQIKESILDTYGLKFNDINIVDATFSLFLHGNLFHLLGNMWFLYLFGSAVEGRLRTPKFLLVYFVAGFAGDALHLTMFGATYPDLPGIGASGAIMGLMGAALYMFPYAQIDVFYWWWYSVGTTCWQLRWIAALYVAYDVFEALLFGADNGVANLAHLGGVAGGFAMVIILRAKRDTEQASEAKATLAEVKDYSVLASYELEEMAKSNPNDTLITLHWMSRALRDPGGPKPACRTAFFNHLNRIVREQPGESVAQVLAGFASAPAEIPPRCALDVAMRIEGGPAPQLALQLYDMALRSGKADDQEVIVALLRGGILCENRLGNVPRAIAAYQEVVKRDAMGPFGQQAKHRLESLQRAGRV